MKACAFCPRIAEMSGEHIWDDWINKALAEVTPIRRFTINEFREDRVSGTRVIMRSWPTRNINATANVVCTPCNNTWMSDVTNETSATIKDILRFSAPLSFLPLGIVTLATFTFMKAVVADHLQLKRTPFFSPQVRHEFGRSQHIPDGVQIWMGRYQGQHVRSGRFANYYFQINGGDFRGFEFYVFTYVFTPIALQLTARRWRKPSACRSVPPLLRQNAAWTEGAVEIWPSNGTPINWPPPKTIGDDTLEIFIKRWLRLAMPR